MPIFKSSKNKNRIASGKSRRKDSRKKPSKFSEILSENANKFDGFDFKESSLVDEQDCGQSIEEEDGRQIISINKKKTNKHNLLRNLLLHKSFKSNRSECSNSFIRNSKGDGNSKEGTIEIFPSNEGEDDDERVINSFEDIFNNEPCSSKTDSNFNEDWKKQIKNNKICKNKHGCCSNNSKFLMNLLVCSSCSLILSLKDKFQEFEGTLTDDDKNKLLELQQRLTEYELTYNQELRVLMLLARQAVSWKFFLPLFNRRCISRNIEKIKLHSDYLEHCITSKNYKNVFELIEIFDAHMDEKYLSLLVVFCENMGELRMMFRHHMKRDPDFLKILFSNYFQIERTLLPLHHLTYIQSMIIDLIDMLPHNLDNVLYYKMKCFDRKLSKMLAKCYEITTIMHGTKFLQNIENLFPFDLNFSTSINNSSVDMYSECNAEHIYEELKEVKKFTNKDNNAISEDEDENSDEFHDAKDETDLIRNKILNKNEEMNLIDLNTWVKNLNFGTLSNKKINRNSNTLENIDDTENFELVNGKLKLSDHKKNSSEMEVKEIFSDDTVVRNKVKLFSVLPFPFNYSFNRKSNVREINESYEMVELSPISYQARLRFKKQCGTLPRNSLLNKSYEEEPIYQIYTESSLQTDIELYTSEEKEKLNKSSTVFYVETQNEDKKTDNKSIKISTCGDRNESSKEENSSITRPVTSVQRTLWKETDEVIKHGILEGMSKCEIALQESKYEILTSEVSYLKSLTILVAVFIESPELTEILSEDDKDDLFRHVIKVKDASEKFLYDLAGHWEEDVLMKNVYNVIDRHIDSTFSVYIDYCSNQICLHRTLQRLLLQDNKFLEVTKELENSPECLGYSLDSFLTLPMQRVTRLPLLMQAVQRRLPNDSEELEVCNRVVNSLCQLVKECNESVRRMEENYEKSCAKKKMSLDLSSKVISPKKSVKKEKSSNSRRWSLFTVREVKTTS